jgi:Mg-chelatase subunit ChlD
MLSSDDDKQSKKLENIPDAYICPITHQIMKEPFIDSDGNSYEKDAITQWLKTNSFSPITRNQLSLNTLIPNRVLKDLIVNYCHENGIYLENNQSEAKDYSNYVSVDLKTAMEVLNRKPLLLYALIDTSGSMGSCCGQNADGEDDGYNRLDLVKHTLNTVITSLTEFDRICIIQFNQIAELLTQPMYCSDTSKHLLMDRIKHLTEGGQTNIWDALRLCVDNISSQNNLTDCNVEVYLLTDGTPNINPPRPIVDTMNQYIRQKFDKDLKVRFSTFAYGYDLDSDLCYNISQTSNGMFGFIPDSTMVGTVFINSLSQSLIGTKNEKEEADDKIYSDVLLDFTQILKKCTDVKQCTTQDTITDFYTQLQEIHSQLNGDPRLSDFVSDLMKDCENSDDPNTGQIFKAMRPDFFRKWGKHYLLSVLSAFMNKICINFKDKAMQHFRNEKFIEEQSRIENVFIQLPPPEPSIRRSVGNASFSTPPPTNMTGYYNYSGGCFTCDSKIYVLTKENSIKLEIIKNVRSGMTVLSSIITSSNNKTCNTLFTCTEIETVVEMPYSGNIYSIGALSLTPYHPIMINGIAQFPIECVFSEEKVHDISVYDLVLRNRGLIVSTLDNEDIQLGNSLPSITAATWGHNCKVGVFEHEYFGSEQIVEDLKRFYRKSYNSGHVKIKKGFIRDPESMKVQSLCQVEPTNLK